MRTLRGNIFMPDGTFCPGEIEITGNRISKVRKLNSVDLSESEASTKILPGLCDIHSHGCVGHDTCDATEDELIKMLEFERSIGVTSYCPTTMTYDEERLNRIVSRIASVKSERNCSVLKGIYLEGPFISVKKKGAQNEKYITAADYDMTKRLVDASKGLAKVIAIAPETEGAISAIGKIKDIIRVSVAHTDADYDTTCKAFECGAAQVTHLYNGMSAYNHRNPGVIGAVFDNSSVMAELICDGIHIHEAVIRNTFKALGADRVILISDSMEATGMENGTYALGGQTVYVDGRRATLSDGTLAGSASTLPDCLRYAISIGVPAEQAIWAATRNPARAIGTYNETGSIEEGKLSELIVVDDTYNVLEVITEE